MDLAKRIAKLTPEQRAQLDARLRKRPDAPLPQPERIERRPVSEPCPLSFSQERLWFLEQLEGPSATYNIYSATRFRGPLRVACLEQALKEIVSRHESLRTTFPVAVPGDSPIQRIGEASEFHLEVVDVSGRADAASDVAVEQWANEFARQPMRLAEGPLFRARLLRLGFEDHVLAVVMHHIISDGWSLGVFFRELHTLYGDFLSGGGPSLAPLPIHFGDFARWQRQHLQGEVLKRHLDYWKARLGSIPILELPSDFPRPAEQTYRGASCIRRVGRELAEGIRRLSREAGATLFMTLFAAFEAQLHRYTGQPDILVGTPVTSRDRVELEPLMGFFVNMLVLRADFSGDPTVRELIEQVRRSAVEAMAHQGLPFENLVRELHPNRSLSYSPLFQVAFMFEEAGPQSPQLHGLDSEPIPVNTGTAKFDLTLFVRELDDGLEFGLEYATDLFAGETAGRMLGHLECLLTSMVADPSARVSRLNLLTPEERRRLLVDWNQTSAEFPSEQPIHALFEEHVRRDPDAVAVEFDGERVSYSELDRRAEALAVELRDRGVGAGALVGLFVERSAEMVAGVLGILKAGAAYVPLDPSFPKERLTFMVADARLSAVVTQQRLVEELPEHRAQVVCIDAATPDARISGIARREPGRVGGEAVAYVIYTSGSTGRPKGVQIPHRAVVNFLQSMRRKPGMKAEDVLLAITTLSFDIAGLELLLPLAVGARVVIVPRDIVMDGARLSRLMETAGATVMQGTPSNWRVLLGAGWNGRPGLKILCGGEALPPELARDLLPRCAELWNMYGPTETTIWSTLARVQSGEAIHIGRPIDNTDVYILDAHLEPVPVGVAGELYIGGEGVALGYLNQPELTAEKFVPHPFKPGKRLYRTGDLARYRSDGNMVCLGRVDFQVKIRGHRVELGEIESILARHSGVAQAVVAVDASRAGVDQLAAYVVPLGGAMPAPAELREHLRAVLPDYMVPAVYVPMERFPLTPNGKVDRKALPRPTGALSSVAAARIAPRSATEGTLAAIWAEVLGLERVGVTDDFFELGGHSLLAVKLFGEIERRTGFKLPLATLFKAATVEGLARELATVSGAPVDAWSSLVAIRACGTKPTLFCVHGAGGNVLLYRDLAARLGDDFPIYGFQSRGLDGHSRPLGTVEEMAEHYLAELRTVQPRGPYCLAGYCLGGMVAYQMARLLRQAGDEVGLLALLDAYNPVAAGQTSRLGLVWQRVKFHAGNVAALRPRELGRYVREKLRVAMDGELSNLLGGGRDVAGTDLEAGDSAIQRINDQAVGRFKPLPYDGPVTLFKPRVNYDFLSDSKMGWGDLVTGGLTLVELPVNPHAMLVEPFVQHLAEALRERLNLVEASRQNPRVP